MGLDDAFYDFVEKLPLLDDIETKMRELSSEKLAIEGTIDPGLDDIRRSRGKLAAKVGMPMRESSARFWIEGDQRRLRRWVKLAASLDGTKIILHSNYDPLFRSACNAMVALGGSIYIPKK